MSRLKRGRVQPLGDVGERERGADAPGGVLKIPARKAPAFAAGKGLKEAVAGAKNKGGAKAKKK